MIEGVKGHMLMIENVKGHPPVIESVALRALPTVMVKLKGIENFVRLAESTGEPSTGTRLIEREHSNMKTLYHSIPVNKHAKYFTATILYHTILYQNS